MGKVAGCSWSSSSECMPAGVCGSSSMSSKHLGLRALHQDIPGIRKFGLGKRLKRLLTSTGFCTAGDIGSCCMQGVQQHLQMTTRTACQPVHFGLRKHIASTSTPPTTERSQVDQAPIQGLQHKRVGFQECYASERVTTKRHGQ